MLIFFLVGLGFGMQQHLMQDSIYNGKDCVEQYISFTEHPKTTFKQAICLIIYNNNSVCDKYKEGDEE